MPEPNVQQLHESLVQKLLERGELHTPAITDAFRAISRHHFLPDHPLERIFQDMAITTKRSDGIPLSSSSQPAMMAIMLEQLALQPGENVLEIGAGTGYNAALMAHLVGPAGRVTTIDIDQDIVDAAQENLQRAGVTNVHLHCGDGADGYAAHAPYDRIILTVAAPDIMPAWMAQLRENGRILLPLTLNGPQISVVFDRRGSRLVSGEIAGCGFIVLRGGEADPLQMMDLPGLANVRMMTYETGLTTNPARAAELSRWLQNTPADLTTDIETGTWELMTSWRLWQTTRPHIPQAVDANRSEHIDLVPYFYGLDLPDESFRASVGIIDEAGMAFFMRPPEQKPLSDPEDRSRRAPFPLHIRGYGPQGMAVAEKLRTYVRKWDAAGRPDIEKMQIIASPHDHPPAELPPHRYTITLQKKWRRYQMFWPVEDG